MLASNAIENGDRVAMVSGIHICFGLIIASLFEAHIGQVVKPSQISASPGTFLFVDRFSFGNAAYFTLGYKPGCLRLILNFLHGISEACRK